MTEENDRIDHDDGRGGGRSVAQGEGDGVTARQVLGPAPARHGAWTMPNPAVEESPDFALSALDPASRSYRGEV